MQPISWRDWYYLTKPGIIYGNGIHFVAGFLLASKGGFDLASGLLGLGGTSLLIASACIVNNYFDRDIDARMKRTKKRASVTGKIPVKFGALFAAILLIAGVGILAAFQLWLVLLLGLVAYILYTVVYTYSKRVTVHSTLIGSIPGAIPAMAGFLAPTNSLSLGAWLVFALVLAWQMPHFYAISLFRKQEYAAAKLPVMGVVKSLAAVRWHMMAWATAYVATVCALIFFHIFGYLAGGVLFMAAVYWLYFIVVGKGRGQTEAWARKVFGQSLVITVLFAVLSFINLFSPY